MNNFLIEASRIFSMASLIFSAFNLASCSSGVRVNGDSDGFDPAGVPPFPVCSDDAELPPTL